MTGRRWSSWASSRCWTWRPSCSSWWSCARCSRPAIASTARSPGPRVLAQGGRCPRLGGADRPGRGPRRRLRHRAARGIPRATGLSAVGALLGEISLEPLNTFGELQLRDQRSHETRGTSSSCSSLRGPSGPDPERSSDSVARVATQPGLAADTTHRLRKRKRAAMDARVCRVGPGPDGPPQERR